MSDIQVSPPTRALRIQHVVKESDHYYVLFNEEKTSINITVNIGIEGERFLFNPDSGTATPLDDEELLHLSGYEIIILLVKEKIASVLPFDRTVTWLFPFAATDDKSLLIFSACDSSYLGYAVSLIRSLDVFSPGFQFLLHIVNPSEVDMERLKQLSLTLTATQLSVSVEYSDLSCLTQDQQRTYYACVRFIRLSELLPELNIPILCLDADSLIVNPIDFNFSNKEQAQFCIFRRDLHTQVSDNLSVANGSIWLTPTAGVQNLIKNVAQDINNAFADGSAAWYLDQIVMGRQIKSPQITVSVFNITTKYADWDFRDTSIVWAGKGTRKHMDMRFSLLQRMLSDDPQLQLQARQAYLQNFTTELTGLNELRFKLDKANNTIKEARAVIYMPRLDLPWKEPKDVNAIPPVLAEDTLSLRLHWKEFTIRMANAIERAGIKVDVIELPAWQITESQVKNSGAQLALIPHRCKHDFKIDEFPVLFYMQEYFRWVFVVDKEGWGASSSAYPIRLDSLVSIESNSFDAYRSQLRTGNLSSKFAQTTRVSKQELLDSGQIPATPYIFFPLQIPHDQVIRYFSDLSEQEVLKALLLWSEHSGVPLVLKPHPANPKSMEIFKTMSNQSNVYWSNAHIYDLIEHAASVYTINSGVGLEALFQLKPVITFGRAEYDCVTFNADLDRLNEAWNYSLQTSQEHLEANYRRFIDWFLGDYAVDLSSPCLAKASLDKIAIDIAETLGRSTFLAS